MVIGWKIFDDEDEIIVEIETARRRTKMKATLPMGFF